MVGTRTPAFKSQSQRLAAHTGTTDSKPSRTPPPASGGGGGASLPGFGPLASGGQRLTGGQKLNTPTKKPGGGSAAQGVTDVYEFPWDDDEEQQAAIAGQRSKPAAHGRPAAGPAANRPGMAGAAAAAAAGVGRPKARLGSTVARKLKIPGEQEQQQAPAIQRAGATLSRINSLDHDAATARSLAGAFPAELAAAHPAPLREQQQHTQGGSKQLGIKQFTRVMPPARSAFASGPLPAGMLNHGNTCYLNAILQALLSLPCLAHDLSQFSSSSSSAVAVSTHGGGNSSSFSRLQLPPDGVTAAMVACLRQMSACRGPGDLGSSSAAISPKVVREAMKKRASHWGAARQEDAHEFFTALLNALADEVQQAQLEHMQHSSSAARQKQPAAAATSTAAEAAANGTLELPPSRSSAAQHHQQEQQQADISAAATETTPALTDGPQDEDSRQQEQQQQWENNLPAEELRPLSRQPTPACQLPSMSVSQTMCPVTRNFLGCLQHTYTCSVCGKATVQKEQFNHLILDLPQDDEAGSNGAAAGGGSRSNGLAAGSNALNRAPVADLSSLLANHFNPETCDKACEGCGASAVQHKVEHAVRRLPRVLVVQLKRFKWVISPSGIPDCRKMPTPVQPDRQLFLGRLCVPGRPVPPLLASLMPQRLLRSAMEAAGEQQQQQQHLMLGSSGGGAAAAAAAVADAGLDGALALEGGHAGMLGQQQQQQGQQQPDRWPQKPAAKRLASLRDQGQLAAGTLPKKPKVVGGSLFDQTSCKRSNGSLANFWHSPVAPPRRQQQRALSPDLPVGPWGGDSGAAEPLGPSLRRNNSSSAVPRVDLTGLADAADAAAESEFNHDLQLALALSMQEGQQQQQQQPGHSGGLVGGEASDDADMPGLDDDSLLPSWLQNGYVPAAAAAPPASPVNDNADTGSPAAAPPGPAPASDVDLGADLLSLTPAAAADGIFALTPPQDTSPQQQQQQQQQQADPMDLDQGLAASPVHGLFAGLGPASPVPQAPRQDRSGRVSSSTVPGGSQQRPAGGQKLGGGGLTAAGAPNAAAAAAALQRLNASPILGQPQLLQEVQAAGLSEEEQIKRAIEESMREQQQQSVVAHAAATKPAAAADVSGKAAAAAAAVGSAMDVDQPEVVLLGSDVVEDEEATLKRVMAESAAVYERQQQEQLQLLYAQQQDEAAGGALTASDAARAAPASAAADGQAGAGGRDGSSAGTSKGAAAETGQQQRQQERPPVLLLRLLEDSDYEAEQEELQGSSSRDASRSSSPVAAAAAADGAGSAAAAAAGGEGQDEQPVPSKRRRGRPRKQQQQGPDDGTGAAAAAAAGGSKRLRSQSVGVPGEADGAAAAASGAGQGSNPQAVELVDGLEGDKENLSAAAAAAAAAAGPGAGEGADTDAVSDRGANKGEAACKSSQQKQQKQRRALGEILGGGDSSARNIAAGAAAAAAAAGEPARKPPALAAAVAAAQAAAAGSSGAAAAGGGGGAAAAAAGGDGGGGEVRELEEGVAAGAVGSWPQDAAASYSLSAVVRHMGDLVSAGHFTSDVLNHEAKRWFHYDDSHVQARGSIETVARLCQRDGYLFFYVNDAISD